MSGMRSRTFAGVALAVLVPVAAAVTLCVAPAMESFDAEASADRTLAVAEAAESVAELTHQLQGEQLLAVMYLGGVPDAADRFGKAQPAVEKATEDFLAAERDLRRLATKSERERLTTVVDALGEMPTFRHDVLDRRLSGDAAAFRYTAMVNELLRVVESLLADSEDRTVRARVDALTSFGDVKQTASLEAALVTMLLVSPTRSFPPGMYRDLVATLTDQEAGFRTFLDVATREQVGAVEEVLSSPANDRIREMEDALIRAEDGPVTFRVDAWTADMTRKLIEMRTVEKGLAADLADAAENRRAEANREAWNYVLAAAAIVAAVLIGLLVALLSRRNRPAGPASAGDPPVITPVKAA